MSAQYLEEYLLYPFELDQSYQQGLAGIKTSANIESKSEAERNDILLRSQVFYFNRALRRRVKGCSLTPEDVQRYHDSLNVSLPSLSTSAPQDPEPRTLTFAELKELIESGNTDQIPNNRQIPNDIHTAPPSTSSMPARKKPWEAVVFADTRQREI